MNTVNRADMQCAIEQAINRSCGENDSNTPDFILAQFLMDCFDAFTACSLSREKWYGKSLSIGGTIATAPDCQTCSELRQAIGLLTTLHPTMVMDPDHPFKMAQEIERYVNALLAAPPATGGERTCETCCEQGVYEVKAEPGWVWCLQLGCGVRATSQCEMWKRGAFAPRTCQHPNATEYGEQENGWPGGDIVRMRCPDCNKTWKSELPQ